MPLPLYLFSKTPHPDAIHVPIIKTLYLRPAIDFSRYDGIILTSKEAVKALEKLGAQWRDLPLLCVGTKTAEYARRWGGRVLQCAEGYGDGLERLILETYVSIRWLYARPRQAASDFAERLRCAGVAVEDIVVYETSCNDAAQIPGDAEAVLAFTSPSSVACFLRRSALLPTHRVVVIGRTTAAALPQGVTYAIAETPSVDALVLLGKEIARGGGGI